jgi:alkylation response protein AidB-like acyl-CoA dehydrogenase
VDLNPTTEQLDLADSAAAFLGKRFPTTAVREAEASDAGFSTALWSDLASLGWPALILPESGGGIVELAILAEVMGRFAVSSPLIAVSLAAWSILWAGTQEQQERLLPGIASGDQIAAVAVAEPGQHNEWAAPGLRGTWADGCWRLSGVKTLVPYAGSAGLLIASANLEGAGQCLLLLDPALDTVAMRRHKSFGGEPLYEVRLDGAVVTADDFLGPPGSAPGLLSRILDHAAALHVCYAVGLAEAALELTVNYARSREQFGRPIGAFQAVANRCADMRSSISACKYLALKAAAKLGGDSLDGTLDVSVAKAYANQHIRQVFVHAHQVHGAIGYSTEYDLQLYTRRAKAFELANGSSSFHRSRIATAIGL